MSRRTYVIALAACLPAGALLEAATHRNAFAVTIVVTAAVTSTASTGWYGPKTVLERRRIPDVPVQPEPGPGRRRATSTTATMAVRPYSGPEAAVDERELDEAAPAQEQVRPDTEASTTLTPPLADLPPRTTPDPYVYRPDDEATGVLPPVGSPAADALLAAASVYFDQRGATGSHWTAGGEDLYAGHREPVATPS